MRSLLSSFLLRFGPAIAFMAAAVHGQRCLHGLTVNNIATNASVDLKGKIALVTGGRSGLGYAIAEALLHVNCTVVIASRNITGNQQAVASLRNTVGNDADVSYMIFDLESFDNVREFASTFIANHTRLDYYFANAGQAHAGGAAPLTVDGYERVFQVNYVSQVLLLELLLPLLRKSQPARALLTASSTHAMACGSVYLSPEDRCWGEMSTVDMLPFDQAGLDAIGSNFTCMINLGTYPITKYLMTQLALEVAEREAEDGNQVYLYSWAPGNIRTNLNPQAICCAGPIDNPPPCRYQLPYVGPRDLNGEPNPPWEHNHWSSPVHGAMVALFTALQASPEDTGKFYATYWECEANRGYFPQGITPEIRSEIYVRSQSWVHLTDSNSSMSSEPALSGPTASPVSDTTTSAAASANHLLLKVGDTIVAVSTLFLLSPLVL